MAVKLIATHYNFEGNEIQNVSLQKLATDPPIENLKDGMIWLDTTSKKIKLYDGEKIRSLFWADGLYNGQTISGGNNPNGTLIIQSTTNVTKGSIKVPEFNIAGFIKNESDGTITYGNILDASDIPAHAASTSSYGAGDKNNFGHIKISDGIAVDNGVISIDVGTGLTLTGTSPNKKINNWFNSCNASRNTNSY